MFAVDQPDFARYLARRTAAGRPKPTARLAIITSLEGWGKERPAHEIYEQLCITGPSRPA